MSKYPECWVFDEDRRVYGKDERGHSTGGPIYREHWEKREIIGETRVSWLLKYGGKVKKKGQWGVAFSQEEVDRNVWEHENAYRLSELVRRQPYEVLRKIADLIGFTETTGGT